MHHLSVHNAGPMPELSFAMDLRGVNVIKEDERRDIVEGSRTVLGSTLSLLIPPPPNGCPNGCDFCSVGHVKNPGFPIHGYDGGRESAGKIVGEIGGFVEACQPRALIIVNNAGILHGTEWGKEAELNEDFWELLPDELKKYPILQAVDLEVRISDLIGEVASPKQSALNQILQKRLLAFGERLEAIGKELRCVLALEYLDDSILREQHKFPASFMPSGEGAKARFLEAMAFLKEKSVTYHTYAMLGGRLKDSGRALQPDEAINSAARTVLFALQHGAAKAIINSLYLDPVLRWKEKRDGVPFYIPTERDMVETLRLISAELEGLPKIHGETPRVRLTTEVEKVIEGITGPQTTERFYGLIEAFNNAPDQRRFFEEHLASLQFNDGGQCTFGNC